MESIITTASSKKPRYFRYFKRGNLELLISNLGNYSVIK